MSTSNWQLIDRTEMAKRLGISVSQFDTLKRQKKIIPVTLGGRCDRYHPETVIRRLLKTTGAGLDE